MKRAIWKTIGRGVLTAAFLLAVWFASYWSVGNDLLLPSFFDCLKACGAFFSSAAFWTAFSRTLARVAAAFSTSFVLALGLAIVAYLLPSFGRFFAPIAAIVRAVPVLAVLVMIRNRTSGATAPVVVAFLSLFPMLYTEILSALQGVDGGLKEMSETYGVPLWKQIRDLYIPSTSPTLLQASGAAFSFSLKLVVSAEAMVRTATSFGVLMEEAQLFGRTAETFALVIVACLIGFAVESLTAWGARVWRRRTGV